MEIERNKEDMIMHQNLRKNKDNNDKRNKEINNEEEVETETEK